MIDRKDHVVNLFEVKFHNEPFTLTKAYAEELRNKMGIFREATKTQKQLFWVLITTFGIKPNEHSLGLVAQSLTMDDLFDHE